ncbi:uncharacterized protein LOC101741016 [Bombyx mori]|uniref:Uncharacterized protein n=1 Tax=Bombyx mori TaxID=7091 RepID=A0A8R1WKT5_BOMMO|nr:uncharacterized protein LOC101741016 [Bombyx mori]
MVDKTDSNTSLGEGTSHLYTEYKKYQTMHAQLTKDLAGKINESAKDSEKAEGLCDWRRQCGCLRTSEKLKLILNSFPAPPPPTPVVTQNTGFENTCISAYCTQTHPPLQRTSPLPIKPDMDMDTPEKKPAMHRSWQLMTELVQILQLSVTATALAFYYVIYCYMQLIYYTLRSALYFHNADGAMKVTIAVVTFTSLLVGFNLIIRMERLIGIL